MQLKTCVQVICFFSNDFNISSIDNDPGDGNDVVTMGLGCVCGRKER